jgi:hypothetical protein
VLTIYSPVQRAHRPPYVVEPGVCHDRLRQTDDCGRHSRVSRRQALLPLRSRRRALHHRTDTLCAIPYNPFSRSRYAPEYYALVDTRLSETLSSRSLDLPLPDMPMTYRWAVRAEAVMRTRGEMGISPGVP